MSIARIITLPVTLEHDPKPGDPDNMLVVNGGDHCTEFEQIDVQKNPGLLFHILRLELRGNASSGEFCRLDDPQHPGFCWLLRTPASITVIPADKNVFQLNNQHSAAATRGRWYYQLFARFEGMVYGVPLTFAAGGSTNQNPSIKNR